MAMSFREMKISKLSIAILLSLILGLGATASIAHSHDDHQESQCAFAVVQNTAAALAPVFEHFVLPLDIINQSMVGIGDIASTQSVGFSARAPPF